MQLIIDKLEYKYLPIIKDIVDKQLSKITLFKGVLYSEYGSNITINLYYKDGKLKFFTHYSCVDLFVILSNGNEDLAKEIINTKVKSFIHAILDKNLSETF